MPCPTIELQRKYQRERNARIRLDAIKNFGSRCCKCGDIDRLEFDHINRASKVSHNIWSWAPERREAELLKCQLLCHECHKRKTASENGAHLMHGMLGMYNSRGCRCALCREAKNQAIYAWRKKVGGRKAPKKTIAGSLGGGSVP